jgi:P-type Mg2+ transporter
MPTAPDQFHYSHFLTPSPDHILADFDQSLKTGYSSAQVKKSTQTFGRNEIKTKAVSGWHIFARQWRSPFIYMLVAAVTLAFILGELIDGFMISLFIFINVSLGFIQEFRSEKNLQLLKKYLASHATVVRDGKHILVPREDIVIGDLIVLKPGDIVSADARVISVQDLLVDESVLTGESEPSAKSADALPQRTTATHQAKNILFSGTSILRGEAQAIVIATGNHTVFASIAKLTSQTVRVSSFEKGMNRFSAFVLYMVLITLFLLLAANLIFNPQHESLFRLLIFSIALATAAIPEGLPLVITFSLSRGALFLAKHKVVVRRLSAIEDLGGIQVLCTDKTGTITQNKLTVSDTHTSNLDNLIHLAAISIPLLKKHEAPDPFDQAITDFAHRRHRHIPLSHPLSSLPFDPKRRVGSTIISLQNQPTLIVRGAPENILPACHVSPSELKTLTNWLEQKGLQGERVLAIAAKQVTQTGTYDSQLETSGLKLLGIFAFSDPLKPSTQEAINKAAKLGVKVKVITGDNPQVAGFVGQQIGLISSPSQVISGEDFMALSAHKQLQAAAEYHVFARVNPEQKFHIVNILKQLYEVGFLGEGINDAPALKTANVALVVQKASDIARDAADIVLLKSSLKVIIDGIQAGRQVFANTIKYVKITLASNFGNFYAIAIVSFFVDFLPMTALQILLVNLLSDFPLITVVTDTVDQEDLEKPESYNLKEFAIVAGLFGFVSSIFDFLFFGTFLRSGASILQTNWFIGSILTELILIYSLRTKKPFYKASAPGKPMVILTALAAIVTLIIPYTAIGQNVFNFTPPSALHLTLIFSLVIIYFITTEITKLLYYRHFNQLKNT